MEKRPDETTIFETLGVVLIGFAIYEFVYSPWDPIAFFSDHIVSEGVRAREISIEKAFWVIYVSWFVCFSVYAIKYRKFRFGFAQSIGAFRLIGRRFKSAAGKSRIDISAYYDDPRSELIASLSMFLHVSVSLATVFTFVGRTPAFLTGIGLTMVMLEKITSRQAS